LSTLNRALNKKEINRLIGPKVNNVSRIEEWPGDNNLQLLAEAVNGREYSVQFENGSVFEIRYDDKQRNVFVSPPEPGKYVPCGYFEYDQLKGVLA
jgi:hypothetical protein